MGTTSMTMGAKMSADAIRGYIKTLRMARRRTQKDTATHLGMPLTTYKDWELGVTRDMKAPNLIRLVQYLRGSFDQIGAIDDAATADDGAELARQLVAAEFAPAPDETPEEAARISRLLDLLAQGVAPDEAARRVLRGQ